MHRRILRDEVVRLANETSRKAYPLEPLLITALVEVNGRDVEMTFMTNRTAMCSKRATIIDIQLKTEIDQMKQTQKTLRKTGVYPPFTPSMG